MTTKLPIPGDQVAPHAGAEKFANLKARTASTTPPRRQSDRGDDPDDRPALPRFLRFRDLKRAGVVGNWVQLGRLIRKEGFPPGRLFGANSRAWTTDEINMWIESRPTTKPTEAA
jgi:hypothetical protein